MKTVEGSDVLYQYWPAGQAKAALLLVHGMGAHTGRWEALADFFRYAVFPYEFSVRFR